MSTKLSIDIGCSNLHIAEGDFQKGNLIIRGCQSFDLAPGCLGSERIMDAQLLSDTIQTAVKAAGFNTKEAIITVNGTHAIIRELELPKSKPKELKGMIKNEMHQTFHVLNSDIIQFKEIGKAIGEDGLTLDRYRVAAIDQNFVEGYYQALVRAGLKASAMDLNVNAIDKLLGWADRINEKGIEDRAVLLLDFGHSKTTVYIWMKDQPLFYRHLNIGSVELNNILKNTFYMQDADAKNLKEKTDFFRSKEEVAPYFEAMKPFLYHMNDEVRKLITFYMNRTKCNGIDTCYLFGQGSLLAGLEDYWHTSLNMPCEIVNSVGNANYKVSLSSPGHLNAVAALLRYQI